MQTKWHLSIYLATLSSSALTELNIRYWKKNFKKLPDMRGRTLTLNIELELHSVDLGQT